jgi:hypothetical protein
VTAADELLAIWASVTWALARYGWRPCRTITPELEGAFLVLRAATAEIREAVRRP